MKKIFVILAIVASVSVHAQKAAKKEVPNQATVPADSVANKVLTLQGNVQAFNYLLSVLDNPDKALHKDVKAIEEWITTQLEKQLPKQEAPKK